ADPRLMKAELVEPRHQLEVAFETLGRVLLVRMKWRQKDPVAEIDQRHRAPRSEMAASAMLAKIADRGNNRSCRFLWRTLSDVCGFLTVITPPNLSGKAGTGACYENLAYISSFDALPGGDLFSRRTRHLRCQCSPAAGRSGQRGVEPSPEPVSAARRADPEPGRDGQGVCASGTAGARRRHRGSRRGDADPAAGRPSDQSRGVSAVPAKPIGIAGGARTLVGGKRELPGAQIGSELSDFAIPARRHREPHRGGAARLYRDGTGL